MRNQEAHFRSVPTVTHARSTFDRSHSHMLTGNFGDVIPILVDEVLAGDTVSIRTSKIFRLQTLLAPVFSNMFLDTYFFFVPSRLCWDHFKEFMGENTQSAWIPPVQYEMPSIVKYKHSATTSDGFARGTVADYMGIPPGVRIVPGMVNALPFRAYAMICNHFFRDQNLTDPLVIDTGDNHIEGDNYDCARGGKPFVAAKQHDYFTSCLPQPQKGPSVKVPVSGEMPVVPGPYHNAFVRDPKATNRVVPSMWMGMPTVSQNYYEHRLHWNTVESPVVQVTYEEMNSGFGTYPNVESTSNQRQIPSNLWAMSSVNAPVGDGIYNSNVGIDISSLRLAIATQQYYEALARSGSRMEEQIATFFGVTNPDARVQNPEYLGGKRVRVNVHEITNTAQSDVDFLGDVGAQSVTADTEDGFVHSFTEPGYLIGVCVARYEHVYSQGIARFWRRHKLHDFYNPLFAEIGEQPVYKSEIDARAGADDIFGYNEAWCDYRVAFDRVSGELRPQVSGNLAHWTMADNYATPPTLSDSWIRESKDNVDRALAVTSSVANQFFADFYFDAKWTRVMPAYSVPGQFGSF